MHRYIGRYIQFGLCMFIICGNLYAGVCKDARHDALAAVCLGGISSSGSETDPLDTTVFAACFKCSTLHRLYITSVLAGSSSSCASESEHCWQPPLWGVDPHEEEDMSDDIG